MNFMVRRSLTGFSIPSFLPKFSCNHVIPMIIFGILPQIHTLKPEFRPYFVFKSGISSFKEEKFRIPTVYWGPLVKHIKSTRFNTRGNFHIKGN